MRYHDGMLKIGAMILFIFSMFNCNTSSALPRFRGLYVGGGIIDHNAGIAATNATSGEKPFFGEVYTQFSLAAAFGFGSRWAISPDLHYAIPGKTTPEGRATTTVYSAGLPIGYQVSKGLDLHSGPGFLFYQISGSGGTVVLNNASSTSTFAAPNSSTTSRAMYWDFGFGLSFGRLRLDTAVLVTGLFSSTRRALNPVVTLSMEFF